MRRRLLWDCIAGCGLICAAYGIYQMSPSWAYIVVGAGVFIAAEVANALPRKG